MSITDSVRQWLILFRAHTAILEAPLAVLGAALALEGFDNLVLVGWLAFGILYHYVGYGMNSYVDWKKGFDKDDPRKQHHPLNKGTIEPDNAKKAIFGSLALLIIVGIALGGINLTTLASLTVMVGCGLLYNYFGKVTIFKSVPISIVHTMVFVFPYVTYTNEISPAFLLITGAYFIHHIFQIAISGDVKDIDQDEASLIQRLGANVGYGIVYDNKFEPGSTVLFLSYFLCVAEIGLATAGSFFIGGFGVSEPIIILLGIWTLYETDKVVQNGSLAREERVEHMSRRELAGYLLIHSTMIPVVGLAEYGVITALMFTYLLSTSKFMWGNWIKPDV